MPSIEDTIRKSDLFLRQQLHKSILQLMLVAAGLAVAFPAMLGLIMELFDIPWSNSNIKILIFSLLAFFFCIGGLVVAMLIQQRIRLFEINSHSIHRNPESHSGFIYRAEVFAKCGFYSDALSDFNRGIEKFDKEVLTRPTPGVPKAPTDLPSSHPLVIQQKLLECYYEDYEAKSPFVFGFPRPVPCYHPHDLERYYWYYSSRLECRKKINDKVAIQEDEQKLATLNLLFRELLRLECYYRKTATGGKCTEFIEFQKADVRIVEGDLLDQKVEVIVNAWNCNIIPWWLLLPQGVSRAIKRRGGYQPFRELAKHGPIPLGGAVHTTAGKLPFKGIIHVAGINMLWFATEKSIRKSVWSALELVTEMGYRSIAFPLIGAGTGGASQEKTLRMIQEEIEQSAFDGEAIIVKYKKQ